MVVGKTFSSMTLKEVLKKYGEVNILASVFPEITYLPYLMSSPLRKDNHPSFDVYMVNGHVRFKDFADNSNGGLVDLLCAYWKCSIPRVVDKIITIFNGKKHIEIKPAAPIRIYSPKEFSNIQVTIRRWRKHDIEYWESYGVSKDALKYAEIYPISHKIVINERGQRVFPADKYAYCFVERKEGHTTLKIYQPFNKKGYKWCSKMDGSVIGLWTKIPEFGDRVILCSSIKDALCVYCQLGIPTLCLQGEGYGISNTAINELKGRYKKVFISFDTDERGVDYGRRLSELTGFQHIVPDLKDCKDYSDYYKALDNKDDFKKLKNLFD